MFDRWPRGPEPVSGPRVFLAMPMLLRSSFVMVCCLAALSLLPSGCCLSGAPRPISGELSGDLFWSGEVWLAGDVVLPADATLRIAPGTRIRFLPPEPEGLVEHPNFPGSELIVRGRIFAVGRPDAPIIFEAGDEQAPPGSWGAVNLEGSPEAIFEYCRFRQADSALHSRESRVEIKQCLFEQNLVGIRFNNTRMLVEHNLLRDNQAAIRFHFGAPVIQHNRFENNRVNLFVTSYPRDYQIESNRFGAARDYQVVLGEEVPDDLLLPGNYWEDPQPRDLEDTFYDGRRSSYLGKVQVEPRLPEPPRHSGLSWIP